MAYSSSLNISARFTSKTLAILSYFPVHIIMTNRACIQNGGIGNMRESDGYYSRYKIYFFNSEFKNDKNNANVRKCLKRL